MYGWCSTEGKTTRCKDGNQRHYTDVRVKTGDVIDMILDLNTYTLSYKCNEQDLGVAFKNIEETTYRAAVGYFHGKDAIKFISYKSQS